MHDLRQCRQNAPLLSAWVDGEVNDSERVGAERLVQDCAACAARSESYRSVGDSLRNTSAAGPDVWGRLLGALDAADAGSRAAKRRRMPLAWAGACLLLVVAVWAMRGYANRALQIGGLANGQTAPVTASLSTHSLSHAVGWAQGRLESSFTPISLDRKGYRLSEVGETLVDGVPAAVFSYRGRGRAVRIYQLSATSRPLYGAISTCPEDPPNLTMDGPDGRLYAWLKGNRVLILAGDLSSEELRALAAVCVSSAS